MKLGPASPAPWRATVLALLVVVPLATAVGPAGAGMRSAATQAQVSLLEQPAWAALGTDLPLRLGITGDTTGLSVRAVVHASVGTRTGFTRTLHGARLGSVLAVTESAVAALPASPGGRVLTLPLQDPNQPRDPNRLRIPLSGRAAVYPVEVELRSPDTGERADAFVTYLVAVAPLSGGPPVAAPLQVAWIWHLLAEPSVDPESAHRVVTSVGPTGRVGRLVTALPTAADVPVILAPGPETLDVWAAASHTDPSLQAGLETVRAAARTHQVLAAPYVPIDVPGLQAAGLGSETSNELAAGSDALNDVLATRVDRRTSAVTPLDATALARLREAGVDRLVLRPDDLQPSPVTQSLTPARPFAVDSEGRRFTAVQTDPGLTDLLSGTDPAGLRAQRFLAGLCVVALEQPSQARGVVVEASPRSDVDAQLLETVLNGLRGHPLLRPVALDGLFQQVPLEQARGAPLARRLAPAASSTPAVSARSYRQERARLDAFAGLVGAQDPTVQRGDRTLLVALSSTLSGSGGRRRAGALLDAIDLRIRAFVSRIEAPPARTVTLTSRSAAIPVSLLNQTGRPVQVRVQLVSEKLRFPRGSVKVLTLPPRNLTTRFEVQARTSGNFPLRVVVTSADGRLPIQKARYTVRSSVVSGVGIAIAIGAGVFLGLWWITHWRRSRKRSIAITS